MPKRERPDIAPTPGCAASDLATSVMADFEALGALMHSQAEAALAIDLTRHQMKALVAIGRDGPLPVGAVAHHLEVSLPTASQLVERLVAAGVVERAPDPNDRRVVLCRLTVKGEDIHDQVTRVMPTRVAQWLTRIDAERLRELHSGLEALVVVVREETRREGGAQHAGDA